MTSIISAGRDTEGLGIGIGLGIPMDVVKPAYGEGLGLMAESGMCWPYTARHHSSTLYRGGTAYDSSPTLSSSSASSDSTQDRRVMHTSATHDVLLSYLSPALSNASSDSDAEVAPKKVYLLSSGTKNPVWKQRRCRSETFKFPLPPSARSKIAPLKSALRPSQRSSIQQVGASPPLRVHLDAWKRRSNLSPALEQAEPTSGWSPYSSHAPTPRPVSQDLTHSVLASDERPPSCNATAALPAYSPPELTSASSCSDSSRTLVSDTDESDAEAFGADAAKLARLHASLFLLDRNVSELPLSLADKRAADLGGSVEEKMAYLCGLGYRYRRTSGRHARKASAELQASREQKADVGAWWSEDDEPAKGEVQSYAPVLARAVRVVSNTASAVTSSCSSPILAGPLAAHTEEVEGDVTTRPRIEEGALGGEFSYLVQESPVKKASKVEMDFVRDANMSPPLSTPELELELGGSPLLLDGLPSPIAPSRTPYRLELSFSPRTHTVEGISGCRPLVYKSALPSMQTSEVSLAPPAKAASVDRTSPAAAGRVGMSTSQSCPALLDEGPATIERATRAVVGGSVLARPRPVRGQAGSFFSRGSDTPIEPAVPIIARARPVRAAADHHSFTSQTAVRKRKPSAKLSVQATVPALPAVRVPLRKSSLDLRTSVHPNTVCDDPRAQRLYYSSATAYLSQPVADAADAARARRNRPTLPSSTSMPVLTPAAARPLKGILLNHRATVNSAL